MSWFLIYRQGHLDKTPQTYFIWKLSGPCQDATALFPTKYRPLIKLPLPGSSPDPKGTAQNTERFAKRHLILQKPHTCPQKRQNLCPRQKRNAAERSYKTQGSWALLLPLGVTGNDRWQKTRLQTKSLSLCTKQTPPRVAGRPAAPQSKAAPVVYVAPGLCKRNCSTALLCRERLL